MANTARRVPAGVVQDTSKNGGPGRPPGTRNKPKDTNGNKFDYSKFKLSFRKTSDFAAFLAGYPDKRALQAYIYRLRPAIDVTLIGAETLAIHTTHREEEMREDWVASRFGRGHYQLKLSDANRQQGQTEVCKVWFEIEDPEVQPPVYDPRTLVLSDPKNADEVNRLLQQGILIDDNGRIRMRSAADGVNHPAPVANPATATPAQVGGLEQTLLLKLIEGVINQRAQSPSDAVKDTIAVAQLLHPPQAAISVEDIVSKVVEKLKPAGDGSMFENYERVQGFIDKIRGVAPVSGVVLTDSESAAAGGGPSWAPHVEGILREANQLVGQVAGLWGRIRPAQPAAAPPQNRQAAPPQQSGPPAPITLQDRIAEVAQLGFVKMLDGVAGFDYASYVCNFHPGGLEVYRYLEPMGAAGVIGMAAMDPTALGFVNQHRPQLEEFLADFFTFDPEGSTSDEAPAEKSAAAAAAAGGASGPKSA